MFFKKKKRNLFIHIPKAGGSTFVGLLKDSHNLSETDKATLTHVISRVGDVEIKHIDFNSKDRVFKEPAIFKTSNQKTYQKNVNLFLLVRDPANRLLSEFNFQYHILNGKNGNKSAAIINKLERIPKNFEEYISSPETQDYQCKFLLGRGLADKNEVTEEEFQQIITAIDKLPIYCGVTEKYSSFLNSFVETTNIELNKTIVIRKKTPSQFSKKITPALKDKIQMLNQYDVRLYEYITAINKQKPDNEKFTFQNQDKFIP